MKVPSVMTSMDGALVLGSDGRAKMPEVRARMREIGWVGFILVVGWWLVGAGCVWVGGKR